MTIKEGIYDIRESLKALNIDSEISNRHIYFLMNMHRRLVIRQHFQKNPGEYRDQLTQSLNFLLETTDVSRFPLQLNTGANAYRTVLKIPDIIGQQIIKDIEVRTIGRLDQEIEMISKARATEAIYAPAGFIYGYIEDDRHLYLLSHSVAHEFISSIVVTAVLEDTKDAESISGEEVTEYHLPANLWVNVKKLVLNSIDTRGVVIDTLNNDADEQFEEPQA